MTTRDLHGEPVRDWPAMWTHNRVTCTRCGTTTRRGGTNHLVPACEYLCRDCKDVEPDWNDPSLRTRIRESIDAMGATG